MIDRKKIATILQQMKCKEHNQHPTVKVIGKSIKLTTCCESFQQQLEGKISEEIEKQTDDAIDDLFN